MPEKATPQKTIRRLGPRLNHLFQWVKGADEYDDIWDLCCDHGRLGMHLHQRHPSAYVHLVDQITSIIEGIKSEYAELDTGRLSFDAMPAEDIELVPSRKHLIILAGVGGENLLLILKGILKSLNKSMSVVFLLSPNSHMYELRCFLRDKNFSLLKEEFVSENNFFHEHLFLCYQGDKPLVVSGVGGAIWLPINNDKLRYLNKLIIHYENICKNSSNETAEAALHQYQELVSSFNQK